MAIFERTELLLGAQGMERLSRARVAVFGVGGVGGYAAEALVRSGIGSVDLVDSDHVSDSNRNRQIIALASTVGRPKVDVMAERLRDINPDAQVRCCRLFYLPDTVDRIDLRRFDYIIDAVDTVTAKLTLIQEAAKAGTPVISAMGAGNKLDLTRLRVADIRDTEVCPLARIMRKELRKRGIQALKVVYSAEPPRVPGNRGEAPQERRTRDIPGSAVFVPAAMGLALASEVVRDLAEDRLGRPLRSEQEREENA
ncbi:MAG: tRNA threonylcarbamoyladenosine dehydratase [Clostridia bacterium]|nr:tRNA threonylcarbamoyladenosine dehydratase [Clostridia bacterium]